MNPALLPLSAMHVGYLSRLCSRQAAGLAVLVARCLGSSAPDLLAIDTFWLITWQLYSPSSNTLGLTSLGLCCARLSAPGQSLRLLCWSLHSDLICAPDLFKLCCDACKAW